MLVTPERMQADIACDRYRFSADPPFSIDTDEDVPPDETPAERWQPGYWRYASAAQRERYMQQVQQVLLGGGRGEEKDVLFAFYSVDFHIHQHHLARRSSMNLCQTVKEMRDVRLWQWQLENMNKKVDDGDGININDDVNAYNDVDGNVYDNDNINAYAYDYDYDNDAPPQPLTRPQPPSPSSTWHFIKQQRKPIPLIESHSQEVVLWRIRNTVRQRAQQLRAVRARFRTTMRERAQQREDGLLFARYQATVDEVEWLQRQQLQQQQQMMMTELSPVQVPKLEPVQAPAPKPKPKLKLKLKLKLVSKEKQQQKAKSKSKPKPKPMQQAKAKAK